MVVFESWKLYHCVAQEPTNLKPLTRNNQDLFKLCDADHILKTRLSLLTTADAIKGFKPAKLNQEFYYLKTDYRWQDCTGLSPTKPKSFHQAPSLVTLTNAAALYNV